jgi:hypothetical protein
LGKNYLKNIGKSMRPALSVWEIDEECSRVAELKRGGGEALLLFKPEIN